MTQFIRVVKWAEMQHYKDRSPPWIKLHRDLLTSETWVSSSNDDRVLAIAIMMLAADTDNLIPANVRYIQRRAYLDALPDWSGLVDLGFIEIIEKKDGASTVLADARPETETEGETEGDIPLAKANGASPFADKVFWDNATAYLGGDSKRSIIGKWCKDYGKPETAKAITAAQLERAVDPIAFIQRTLRNGKSRAGPVAVVGI